MPMPTDTSAPIHVEDAPPVAPLPASLLARTADLRVEFGIGASSPFCCDEVDGAGFSDLEHLVHELAHALLLPVALGPRLSKRIGDALESRALNEQAHQEACAWVVEFETFRMLGLAQRLDWESCVIEACVQEGVTEQLMSYTRARRQTECEEHARALVMFITLDCRETPTRSQGSE